VKEFKAIFAGGGTGGHLFPALAIAEKLKSLLEPDNKVDFKFVGTRRGIEYRMKDRLGYPLYLISVRGLSRAGVFRNILFPFLLVGGVLKSAFLILRFKPDIIVGTGGYVMGPVIMAAIAFNRHCVIQEQNSYPGLTTRQLASKVDRVFLGFGTASKYLGRTCEIVETGNPVKEVIGSVSKETARRHYGFDMTDCVILILGGSQGARRINQNILKHIKTLPNNFRLIWQAGETDFEEIAAVVGDSVNSRSFFPFTNDIEKAYAAADIAVARAGALTLAELETAGVPSILIPYPYATGDHQRKNAEHFVESGGAVIVEDSRLEDIDLIGEAVGLVESGRCDRMADAVESMRRSRIKPAVDVIAEEILKLTGFRESAG
jgi:UDP-N-acetylglucosamine--N-acetylmuramyl-(pentapeptide) pyrophosphoryl-undecaprenol N-acetylglucosamine transferase